jgi:zinc transporter 2
MEEIKLDEDNSKKEEEENLNDELDNIFRMKTTKTISCAEEEECNKFQAYINHQSEIIKKSLTKIIIFLTFFTAIEFIGSITSNSVGVLTIAAGLFTDLIKSIISIISILIIEKPANEVMTYGYHRSEIIASLCSTLIVLVLSVWIVVDTIEIIMMPRQIDALEMMTFSIIGLIFNIIMRYIKDKFPAPDVDEGKFFKNFENTRNVELKAPLLEDYLGIEDKENRIIDKIKQRQILNLQQKETIHLICDITQCILSIIASILLYYFQIRYPLVKLLDDLCGFTFMVIMLIISVPITFDCVDILMEAAPRDINTKNLYNDLKNVYGVVNVHDVHLWSLSIGRPCISLHILSDYPQKSLEGATKVCKNYGISHCTIQVEDNTNAQRRRLSYVGCEQENENNIH